MPPPMKPQMTMWARITLARDPSAAFAVLRADAELHPPDPLVTDAEPATP
jgi:hypothetical protein